jgi:hypothetical protein
MVHSSPNLTLFIEFTKEAYTDPRKFYNSMLEDFSNVYLIDDNGALKKPKDSSYDAIIAGSDDWVMPVFSKSSKLASQH